MECGWIVTEVGRQPWVVYKVMLTSQAAATAPDVTVTLAGILAVYGVLGAATVGILARMAWRWRQEDGGEDGVPYGPAQATPAERHQEGGVPS